MGSTAGAPSYGTGYPLQINTEGTSGLTLVLHTTLMSSPCLVMATWVVPVGGVVTSSHPWGSPVLTIGPNRPVTVNRPVPDDRIDVINAGNPGPPVIPDPTGPGTEDMPALAGSFDGLTNVNAVYPPDTDGDVGPNHYVQMVNISFQIFSKTGTSLLGPLNNNALWSGFGGDCQTQNDGDPIVQYDQYADRWLMTQFAVGGSTYLECLAVSTTPDPTGSWYRYAFQYTDFPDYPKFGVWPDGYYVSYNMFDNVGFAGTKICAMDRAAMLAGNPATQQCYDLAEEWSLLPSDANGPTPPPAGSPNYFVGEHWADGDKLTMYKFHVDWATPGNSSLAGPITIDVNPFTWACLNVTRGRCVPQKDTAVKLESLGGRAMYRLAYRNFGDHESLVTNHTVAMDGNMAMTSQTGIGWYEIRSPNAATPDVYQEGTTADPNGSTFRFMGSIAQDKQGNMALGYSSSSSTTHPGIEYVGRTIWDPPNQLPQAAATIIAGTGSQTGSAARWGDYSSMQIDPVDDCTFWYTNEYLQTTSVNSWRTRIASFKFPGCGGTVPTTPTAVAAAPSNASATVSFGASSTGPDLPIMRYKVTATPGGASCTTTTTSCTVSGLTNGVAYTFVANARNAAGDSANSAASAPVTPFTVPGAPFAPPAVAGNQDASVSWSPADNGGSAITKYTATAAPGGASCTTSGTTCTVSGLTNGTAYTFSVVATNVAGDGPPSTTAAVTPTSQAQTAKVKTPKKIKPKGKTVLLKKAVKTNAGQKAKATVKVSPKSKKYSKVKITKSGKVTIQTKGKKKLKVTLKLKAPATDRYTAYKYTKKWKVKK